MESTLEEIAKAKQKLKAEKLRSLQNSYSINVLGKEIIVLPNVFYPSIDTILLIESIPVKKTDYVLEPFAGTGVISVLLADKVSKIIATDINPDAVENIKKNISLYNLQNKVTAILTDIFPNTETKFDVIIANPPYTDNKANNFAEKSMWDEGHKTIKMFLDKAKSYLKDTGKIYSSWSNFADFDFFEKIVIEHGFKINKISEISKEWQVYHVYEITQ